MGAPVFVAGVLRPGHSPAGRCRLPSMPAGPLAAGRQITLPLPPPQPPASTGPVVASWLPVAPADRIDSLDILRGMALLGILLMNIEGLAGPLVSSLTGVDAALRGADRAVDTVIYLLVQG